jgi:hypothetical protein
VTNRQSSSATTSATPGTALAAAASWPASLPPNTGDCASVAIFMPGTWTSMPNGAVPRTLPALSSRRWSLPITFQAEGGTGTASVGTRGAASATSAAKARRWPVRDWSPRHRPG